MREGDLVHARSTDGRIDVVGVVVRWDGMDDNPVLMKADQSIVRPLASSCRPVALTGLLSDVRSRILEYAHSAEGIASVKASLSAKPTRIEYQRTKDGKPQPKQIEYPDEGYGMAPGPGHGSPDPRFPPTVLTEGRTSNPTKSLISFVEHWEEREKTALAILWKRSPLLAETFLAIADGVSMKDLAAHYGVVPVTIRSRLYRARELLAEYRGTPETLEASYSAKADEEHNQRDERRAA